MTNEQKALLYATLLEAHDKAATANMNGSLAVAITTYQASGSLIQALAAACLTQGDLHAPIDKARELLRTKDPAKHAGMMILLGSKVPGFGNSFYKDRIDPAFQPVWELLCQVDPEGSKKITAIWAQIGNTTVWPNAAILTAACMEALDITSGMGPAVFIHARVRAWAEALLGSRSLSNHSALADT